VPGRLLFSSGVGGGRPGRRAARRASPPSKRGAARPVSRTRTGRARAGRVCRPIL